MRLKFLPPLLVALAVVPPGILGQANENNLLSVVTTRVSNDAAVWQMCAWKQQIAATIDSAVEIRQIDVVTIEDGVAKSAVVEPPKFTSLLHSKKSISDNHRDSVLNMVQELDGFLMQYWAPRPEELRRRFAEAGLARNGSDAGGLTKVDLNNFVTPGDSMKWFFSGDGAKNVRTEVSTTFQGERIVAATEQYRSYRDDFSYPAKILVQWPAQHIEVRIENYDLTPPGSRLFRNPAN